ncbi:MAG: STAS domain-containing protein [Magnetococcus sp. YQC-5]
MSKKSAFSARHYYTYPSNMSYIVDLSDVTLMDSSAMGMLVILRTHAGGDHADLTIKNLSVRLRNVFKTLKMDGLFVIA